MATQLRRFKRLPGARKARKAPRPQLTGRDPKLAERAPDQVQRLTRDLGGTSQDAKLAKRVFELKPQYPAASIPELVTYLWLESQKIPYTFQATLYGGRRAKGGLVPDFIVQGGGGVLAWLVQGEYWHSEAVNAGKDDTARYRLLGQQYQGRTITAVVELWEKDVLRKRPIVFQQALLGIGLRG